MARLLFFGKLGDAFGAHEISMPLPDNIKNTTNLREWLTQEKDMAGILSEKSVRIAINSEIVNEPVLLSDTDEIAFMPPVSGG